MSNSDNRLGSLIRSRREVLGLSQRQLAERIGSSGSGTTILRIETGAIAQPRADILTALAHALDLPAADVFTAAGYTVPTELPSFRPYLRAKYHDLPPEALAELDATFADIAARYGSEGPAPGADEQ